MVRVRVRVRARPLRVWRAPDGAGEPLRPAARIRVSSWLTLLGLGLGLGGGHSCPMNQSLNIMTQAMAEVPYHCDASFSVPPSIKRRVTRPGSKPLCEETWDVLCNRTS